MKKFQVKQQTVLGSLAVDPLLKGFSYKIKSNEFKPSPFLTLKKDFSFILPIDARVGDLVKAIKSSNESIGEILIFDVYKNIEKKDTKLSVGVEVEILQRNKVYNAKEINEIMHQVILNVKKLVNAELRS
jgi:phenylalanyl-tRNA synthetase beta subunit